MGLGVVGTLPTGLMDENLDSGTLEVGEVGEVGE